MTNSIFPEANHDARDQKIGDLVATLRSELEETLDAAQDIASEAATTESVDRLLRLHFQGTRLARRLHALGEDGLIALTAERIESASEIVKGVIAEVANECRRRSIGIDATIGEELGASWLDREQIAEAVRCLLDDALNGSAAGTNIEVKVERELGGVSFVVSYRQPGCDYKRELRDECALIVAHRIAESARGTLVREHRGPWSETSLWIPQAEGGYASLPLTPHTACAVAA